MSPGTGPVDHEQFGREIKSNPFTVFSGFSVRTGFSKEFGKSGFVLPAFQEHESEARVASP
jgi:hypothetical protein